jgi:hypothetical protein
VEGIVICVMGEVGSHSLLRSCSLLKGREEFPTAQNVDAIYF